MSESQKDYYRILGVIDSAETAVIKAAYKALMMIYHPDRFQGSKDEAIIRSQELNEAYSILIDPVKRKIYDSSKNHNYGHNAHAKEENISSKERNKIIGKWKRIIFDCAFLLFLIFWSVFILILPIKTTEKIKSTNKNHKLARVVALIIYISIVFLKFIYIKNYIAF